MWPVLSGILIAVVTASATVYVGRHSKSGRIETSEAKELWDTLRGELSRLQSDATTLRAEISTTYLEMSALREAANTARIELVELRMVVDACSAENERLQTRLKRRRSHGV